MDFLVELFMEVYLGLAEILIPEHKLKKWQETLLKLAGVFVSLSILACFWAGICLLIDNINRALGIALIIIASVLLAIQLTVFVVVLVHQIKAEKRGKKALSAEKEEKEL